MSELSIFAVDGWRDYLPVPMVCYLRLACVYVREDIWLEYRQYIVSLEVLVID